jgi:DNA-binding transcriptional regulator YiaG
MNDKHIDPITEGSEVINALDELLIKLRETPRETTIRDIVRESRMTQRNFAAYLNIPLRTVEDWCRGIRKCPEYVRDLIVYRLKNEGFIDE